MCVSSEVAGLSELLLVKCLQILIATLTGALMLLREQLRAVAVVLLVADQLLLRSVKRLLLAPQQHPAKYRQECKSNVIGTSFKIVSG